MKIDNNIKEIAHKSELLNSDLLAYCGYVLKDNKLIPTYYEPDPYIPISEIKKRIEKYENDKDSK